jgi:hypothetical protein
MSNGKRKRTAKRATSGDKAARNAVLYIAKLKTWLRKEQKWQRDMQRIVARILVKIGDPTNTPPPPPPPYRP